MSKATNAAWIAGGLSLALTVATAFLPKPSKPLTHQEFENARRVAAEPCRHFQVNMGMGVQPLLSGPTGNCNKQRPPEEKYTIFQKPDHPPNILDLLER